MLSWIAGDLFAASPVLTYALAALAIQFTVFCSVGLRALFRSKEVIDTYSRMPLNDEDKIHD